MTGPPPPPGGPAAPPPPPVPAPAPLAAAPIAQSQSDSGRNMLLEQIRGGASLKHRDPSERDSVAPPPTGLADTLARAMEARRVAIATQDDEGAGSDWSDDEWNE